MCTSDYYNNKKKVLSNIFKYIVIVFMFVFFYGYKGEVVKGGYVNKTDGSQYEGGVVVNSGTNFKITHYVTFQGVPYNVYLYICQNELTYIKYTNFLENVKDKDKNCKEIMKKETINNNNNNKGIVVEKVPDNKGIKYSYCHGSTKDECETDSYYSYLFEKEVRK